MKVLVVDDSESFRDGLISMLAAEPDIEVVGEAPDGDAGLRLALEHHPDVVLMDLTMPGTDGLEATRRLTSAAPHVGVVALTLRSDDEAMTAALAAGARGYVVKGASRTELLRSIRAVASGEAVFGPAVAARIAGSSTTPAVPRFRADRSTTSPTASSRCCAGWLLTRPTR